MYDHAFATEYLAFDAVRQIRTSADKPLDLCSTLQLRAIRRIANGYPFKEVQEPLVVQGEIRDAHVAAAEEMGMTLAAGLDAGIF